MDGPWRLSARAALAALKRRDFSARDLLESCLGRIDALDPAVHAFITLCIDRARAEAQASDERRDAGHADRPLEGLPFAVKDLADTADVRTTYGSLAFKDHVPAHDELCVARLRAAGAILVGKTNTPEFGFGPRSVNRLCPSTANPHDLALSAGGSSGGSAAAVAAGFVPFAHGTDFGGSLRTPAAFCGVVGLRPTPGRIPSASKALAWNALSTHGILARNADDAALTLSIMAGHDRRDPLSQPGVEDVLHGATRPNTRIGATADLGVAPMSRDVRTRFEEAIGAMGSIFPRIEPASPNCAGGREAFGVLRGALVRRQFGWLAQERRDVLTPQLLWNLARGEDLTADEFLAAEEVRTRIYSSFIRFFETFEVLVTPSAAVLPFPNGQEEVTEIDGRPLADRIDYLAITFLVSLVGLPSMSIPYWGDGSTIPIGLQIVAPPWREDLLLSVARRLESAPGFAQRWPE